MDVKELTTDPHKYLSGLCQARGISLHGVAKKAGLNHQLIYNWKKSTPVSFLNVGTLYEEIMKTPVIGESATIGSGKLTLDRLVELGFESNGMAYQFGDVETGMIFHYPGEDIWVLAKRVAGKHIELPVAIFNESGLRSAFKMLSDSKTPCAHVKGTSGHCIKCGD
jgi:hypothetical protein